MGLMGEPTVDIGYQEYPYCMSCLLAPAYTVTNYAGEHTVYRDLLFMSWDSLFEHIQHHQELGHYVYVAGIQNLRRACENFEDNKKADREP